MKKLLFLALIATSCSTAAKFTATNQPSHQQPFKAVGIGAFDGDSPTIKVEDSTFHVRLYGIDAPERMSLYVTKAQPGSEFAGLNLRQLIKKDTVTVVPIYVDQFDRLVCKLYTSDSINVSLYQVVFGNAWYRTESGMTKGEITELKAKQELAKDESRGLWGLKGRKYTPAWWRKTYSGWKER